MYGLVKLNGEEAKDCDKRHGMAAQPDPRGAVSDGWSLLNVLRTKAHRRQSRGAAGPVRRAGGGGRGGGGGSGAAAPGGAERGLMVFDVQAWISVPCSTGTCQMAQL